MAAVRNDLIQMINALTDEEYFSVVKYIEFLSHSRQNNAKNTLHQIQNIFADDKGRTSEEEMIKDMADFRRKRESICVY